MLASAFATEAHGAPDFFHGIAGASVVVIEQADPRSLSMMLWAYASMG